MNYDNIVRMYLKKFGSSDQKAYLIGPNYENDNKILDVSHTGHWHFIIEHRKQFGMPDFFLESLFKKYHYIVTLTYEEWVKEGENPADLPMSMETDVILYLLKEGWMRVRVVGNNVIFNVVSGSRILEKLKKNIYSYLMDNKEFHTGEFSIVQISENENVSHGELDSKPAHHMGKVKEFLDNMDKVSKENKYYLQLKKCI